MFTVINAIQHFINAGEKEAANHYLADFARLIRMSSGFSGKSLVLLEEEIAYLQLYLSFEKLRFDEQFNYKITINPAIDISKTSIAVMMIQPFLENAIWHGILPMNAKGYLNLQIDRESSSFLKIIITDNGVGIKDLFINNNLLEQSSDIREPCIAIQRLKLLAESSCQELYLRYKYLFPEQKNKGTIVEFLLPALFK